MSKCSTCKYRAGKNKIWKCEYILIVGHSRGCECDELCTKYEKGKKIPSPQVIPVIKTRIDNSDIEYFLNKFNHYNY